MPIDAAKALADLDRLIDNIGAAQSAHQLKIDAGLAKTLPKPIDFGQFGRELDGKIGVLSNDRLLIQKGDSYFGQFGQQNFENEHIGPDLTDFEKLDLPGRGGGSRAHVVNKSTVQTVHTVQSIQSLLNINNLSLGQRLDSCGVSVQNPSWMYSAEPGAVNADNLAERAALVAEGAGVPREWAEGFAALQAMPAPPGFWPDRWRRIIDAAGAFIDRWAGEAARLGWTTCDAFGCHDTAPAARFDCKGLVMSLDSYRIISIDEYGADLEAASGAHQRFRRRPLPAGTVPLWHLVR